MIRQRLRAFGHDPEAYGLTDARGLRNRLRDDLGRNDDRERNGLTLRGTPVVGYSHKVLTRLLCVRDDKHWLRSPGHRRVVMEPLVTQYWRTRSTDVE